MLQNKKNKFRCNLTKYGGVNTLKYLKKLVRYLQNSHRLLLTLIYAKSIRSILDSKFGTVVLLNYKNRTEKKFENNMIMKINSNGIFVFIY